MQEELDHIRELKEGIAEARALLDTASNLLHAPLAHLRGTVAFEPHKESTAEWMEKYDALNARLDSL